MKLERTIRRVWCEPWLILPSMHQTISAILARHYAGDGLELDDLFEAPDADMTIVDGVATIPVKGVISKDISKMERMSGAVDVRDVSALLDAAANDPTVSAVVLDVDSPGGTVQGVPELAARVAEVNKSKPIIAYTDGLMASAAYWISAGASAIYASESATIGSIGVYLALMDSSRAHELHGYKVELIKSEGSPLKAAGMPGTSLSDEQRADLQASVDYLYGQFSGFVKANRKTPDESMRGQTFFGSQSIGAGLVDSVSSIERAKADALALAGMKKKKI